MIILGIDTSTNHGSVAIAEDGRLLSESFLPLNSSYSKTLINSLDDLLKKCKIGINDIDKEYGRRCLRAQFRKPSVRLK